ncbi:hypothetical protein SCG7109_AZ_00030 [Chlamydiales bacterium SCGC AG-110-M15]|nr:hypothetical protein SCG7109_AZ_00030 [Chlamydiales bacterium SCGC AG-110-M15]
MCSFAGEGFMGARPLFRTAALLCRFIRRALFDLM